MQPPSCFPCVKSCRKVCSSKAASPSSASHALSNLPFGCRFVRKQAGFDSSHTIACGDSGNDKDMLSGRHRAIVVGNAEPELKQWLSTEKRDMAGDVRVYIADSDMARGIMEGVKHFGF